MNNWALLVVCRHLSRHWRRLRTCWPIIAWNFFRWGRRGRYRLIGCWWSSITCCLIKQVSFDLFMLSVVSLVVWSMLGPVKFSFVSHHRAVSEYLSCVEVTRLWRAQYLSVYLTITLWYCVIMAYLNNKHIIEIISLHLPFEWCKI